MSRGSAIQYRRLRAPQDHGEKLIDPALTQTHDSLQANCRSAIERKCDLHGRSLDEITRAARSDMIEAAIRFTSRYRDVGDGLRDASRRVVMTGHQPELYHPGVWIKNFVLDRIAQAEQATAINLLIDNDVIRQPAIRVPSGSVAEPTIQTVAFDESSDELPYEQRRLLDGEVFRSFPMRVSSDLMPVIEQPLIGKLWPEAIAASAENENLGQCLSQARHQLEASWGLKSLELPWSHVCDGDAFRWFAASIIARLGEFQQVYNRSLLEYRRANRIRSRTHPVPELIVEDEWLEAPFWIWSNADPVRRRLFVRPSKEGIEITDRGSQRHLLSQSADGSCEVAVDQLSKLADQGVKLRSRALLTTMFARLCLSDLFIHGIGGAKYDQLTDAIIAGFFRVSAPTFITATATAKLPIDYPVVTNADVKAIDLAIRELSFNPQRHLKSVAKAASLVEAKQLAIQSDPPYGQRSERHLQITHLNDAMQPFVEQQRAELQLKRAKTIELARVTKMLGSREFSFCLFPEATLRALLLDI